MFDWIILGLAAVAFALANRASNRSSGVKDRLSSLEAAVTEMQNELRWLRAERRGEAPDEDGPLFAPDSGVGRPAPAKATPPPRATSPITPIPAAVPQAPIRREGASVPEAPRKSEPADSAFPPLDTTHPESGRGTSASASAAREESLEEMLGTRWSVWAGGAALALGGLFLVKYSIEAGLLGPAMRVFLGALLSAALLAAGEWLRRSDAKLPITAMTNIPAAHIPSVLTAAGTMVAFGTIYAAHAIYEFIGPALAFTLLGATGMGAMLAAALHGPALAGLGLAGSYLTPLLVTSNQPNPWPVVMFLAVVAASAYVLARTRIWLWLAKAAIAGAFFWGLALLAKSTGLNSDFGQAASLHTLLQMGLAAFFFAVAPHAGTPDSEAEPDQIAHTALAALGLLAVLVLGTQTLDLTSAMIFTAILAAGLTATGWLSAPAAAASLIGGAIALVMLLVWPGLKLPPDPSTLMPWSLDVLRLPENVTSFLWFAALSSLAPTYAMATRLERSPALQLPVAGLYALAATLPPLLSLVISYLRVTQFDTSIPFAIAGAALAVAFAYEAERFHKANASSSSATHDFAAGAFAAAAIAAITFALTVSLSRGYLTIALALSALGTAYVSSLRKLELLRYVIGALGLIVLARVVWDPRIMGESVGHTPILNWLLIGYGVPAYAFWKAARWLEQQGNDMPLRLSDSLAALFVGLLAFFEIRHLTNNGDVYHNGFGHVEAGLMTIVGLGLSLALARMNKARTNVVFDNASLVFATLSGALAFLVLAFSSNPLFSAELVGGRTIFSSLLLAYLLPGIASLFVARHARGLRPEWYIRAAGIMGVALIVLYVTLEVRHAFQGADIALDLPTSSPEQWAHSFAWLLLALGFLGYGLMRHSLEARFASLALVALAGLKIVLYDLVGAGLQWRALSLLCFGVIVIGIGRVYQKIIFAPPAERANSTN